MADPTPGQRFGPYEVIAPLGRGGMGAVYRAHDSALDREVALKVLPAELTRQPGFGERFAREAKLIARLEHPHIVPLYASGIEDGVPWMALRLVPGGTMQEQLESKSLGRSQGIALFLQVARALDCAHAQGVIHRDLKPQNLLIGLGGEVYLADFGIARLVEGGTALTGTGSVLGTPLYMAPEQAQGQAIGPACDIYALAVMLFLWQCGEVPFNADTPLAVLLKHVQEPVPEAPLARVPKAAQQVLRRGLAKDPEARWPTATAMVEALGMALQPGAHGAGESPQQLPKQSRPVGTAIRPNVPPAKASVAPAAAPPTAARRSWSVLLLIGALVLAGGVGYLWLQAQSNPSEIAATPAAVADRLSVSDPPAAQSDIGDVSPPALATTEADGNASLPVDAASTPAPPESSAVDDAAAAEPMPAPGAAGAPSAVPPSAAPDAQPVDQPASSAEAERLIAQRLETERQAAQRLETERLEAQRREALRLETQRLDAERMESERLEGIRLAAQRERVGALQAELRRLDRSVGDDGTFDQATLDELGRFAAAVNLQLAEDAAGIAADDALLQALRSARRWPVLSAGSRFRDCAQCPEMVVIPAGSFTLGSPTGEPQRQLNEGPQRNVRIARFALARTEVSFDQWQACVDAGDCSHRPADEGWGRGERPVIDVSWNDAQQYVGWLSRITGERYRLPAEAEWEYAARAGTTTRTYRGDCIGTDDANYNAIMPASGCPSGEFRQRTLPVASLRANPFGLHDMHGNVWEWMQDCATGNHNSAAEDGQPRRDGDCGMAVVRGGGWHDWGFWLRSAARYAFPRSSRHPYGGFRPALSLP